MGLSPQEMDVAQKLLDRISGDKYKSRNYLFLQPFDLSQTPGYMDVVEKKLDIQTVRGNLNAGAYGSFDEFWRDACAIFENAIKYHGLKPTKWIARAAKDLLKFLGRERKALESGGATSSGGGGSGGVKLKIKLPKQGKGAPPGAASGKQIPPGVAAAAESPTAAATAKKTTTLKLKLPTKSRKSETKKAVKAKPTQPKLKLKLSVSKAATAASAAAAASSNDGSKGKGKAANKSKADTAASESAATKPTKKAPAESKKPKITLKLGGSRGKELPEGVRSEASASTPPAASASSSGSAKASKTGSGSKSSKEEKASASPKMIGKATTAGTKPKKTKKEKMTKATSATKAKGVTGKAGTGRASKAGVGKASAATASAGGGGGQTKDTTDFPAAQASKVLAGLRRRQNKSIGWFLQPVSDKAILADYKAKVKHPVDISGMSNKLDRGTYHTVNAFVLDLRRIFSNCLIYNTSIRDSLRPVAVEVLETAEYLLKVFFNQPPHNTYLKLLYCWKLCVGVLDTLYNLVNPDGQPTALYFLQPVSFYCGGQFPSDYLEKVKKPMDFSTVSANLLEGRYRSVEEFGDDCRLVLSNCLTYYNGRDDGKIYMDQANRLSEVLNRSLQQISRYCKGRGVADCANASAPVVLPQLPASLFLSILEDLRALKYTDKATRITEAAMQPFEKPVDTVLFNDYLQFISHPMDLQSIERKVKANAYATPEDFEYDCNLVFRNSEVYNSRRKDGHSVNMAKFASRQFKKVFYAKMRAFEDPASFPQQLSSGTKALERQDSTAATSSEKTGSAEKSPNKKIKIEASGVSKGKSAPRISITAATLSSAAMNAARAKSPATQKNKIASTQQKSNQPVPLHIAIARVKEAFPLRRAHKSLQPWEADCARYFKELMRHTWISAARPKFIFHVPVPTLFPELREAYAAKIRKPMDLTTVECTLLAGNRYTSPDDFVADVAMTFANAIRFNKDGRDIGDPLSCAYYDASVHLLRYSRWLSLEILSQHIDESSEHVDEGGPEGLPPFSWKLTHGNKLRAREEMEKIVLNEPIEKSLEGDRYTWMEAEAEKLLRSLRHQSDAKRMAFFIQPNYPHDYSAYISKPVDWEKCQRTLKKRHYDKFGDIIADLRLIFSNALKYNGRLKGTDTISGQAYDSAKFMQTKLEAAISKLMLNVADRLERERIDHANAEREIEAAERAEEDRLREAWKKDPSNKDKSDTMPASSRPDAVKIRMSRRAAQQAKESTDLETPLFDEDGGQHDEGGSFQEVVNLKKSVYEKQRQDLTKMRQCASALGALAYSRLLQRTLAEQWVEQERSKLPGAMSVDDSQAQLPNDAAGDPDVPEQNASAVLSELEREGRGQLRIKLAGPKKTKGKGSKRRRLAFDFDG